MMGEQARAEHRAGLDEKPIMEIGRSGIRRLRGYNLEQRKLLHTSESLSAGL